MLQARASSIKSGWKPLVGVFRLAAQEPHGACTPARVRRVTGRTLTPPVHVAPRGSAGFVRSRGISANLAQMAYDGARMMFENYLAPLVMQGTFSVFIATLVALAKNRRFEKLGYADGLLVCPDGAGPRGGGERAARLRGLAVLTSCRLSLCRYGGGRVAIGSLSNAR